MNERRHITSPERTGNTYLLAGHLSAKLHLDDTYRLVQAANPLIIEHRQTGNLYRVTIDQIGGLE